MHARKLVAIGLSLAAAITAGGIVINSMSSAETVAVGAPRLSAAPVPSNARVPPSPEPEESSKPERPDGDQRDGPKAPAAKAGPEKALEVPAPTEKAEPGLPPSVERQPPISGPLPKSGSSQGKLVKGFPKDAVPVPKGSRIQISSMAVEGNILQVGLQANTELSPDEVLAVYTVDFTDKGWLYAVVPAADGSHAIRGGFGSDSLTITVTAPGPDSGTADTSFSVFGVLHTGN